MTEAWNDHGYVARDWEHGMLLVDMALADVASGMGVNVCHDLKALGPTVVPQGGIARRVEGDRTGLTSMRIEVVVAEKGSDVSLPR